MFRPLVESFWKGCERLMPAKNFIGMVLSGALLGGLTPMNAQTPVLTRSYNNSRTGANTTETIFTPSKVKSLGLKKCFSLTLTGDDCQIEAQPLYVPGLVMNDGIKHNVVYVCSMSDNVWAFDADTGAPIWSKPRFLGTPFLPDQNDAVDSKHINRSFGIMPTPVIDAGTQIMYVLDWDVDTNGNREVVLHALNLADGQPAPGKPALTLADKATDNQMVPHLSSLQKQRAALLLVPTQLGSNRVDKILYLATTGTESPSSDPVHSFHGWVYAIDVDQWGQKPAAWDSTPGTFGGGIWQSSQGPAADANGDVYFMTANGGYALSGDTTPSPTGAYIVYANPNQTSPQNAQIHDFNGITDYAESFVKLHYCVGTNGALLSLTDWFSPFRDGPRKDWSASTGFDAANYTDQDLGSAAPILPPGMDLVVGSGKDGVLYVLKQTNFGRAVGDFSKLRVPPVFFTFDPNPTNPAYVGAKPDGNLDFQPVSRQFAGIKTHHVHGCPVVWKSSKYGTMLFVWGENERIRAYSLDSTGQTKLLAIGTNYASSALANMTNASMGGMPGGMLTLSANGDRNGIVWATAPLDGDANQSIVDGVVRAYDATHFDPPVAGSNVPRLCKIWEQTGFMFCKFCPPMVADGKLYVPTYNTYVTNTSSYSHTPVAPGRIDVYTLTTSP
jgi:outer membrane protein assembly factor BamB